MTHDTSASANRQSLVARLRHAAKVFSIALSFAMLGAATAQAQDAFVVGTPQSLTGPFAVIGRPMVAGANT